MNSFNKKNYKKFCFIIPILFIIFSLGYIIDSSLSFPREINLIAGKEENFEFNKPFGATLQTEEEDVVTVNSEVVNKSFDVNLNKPFSIQAGETGNINMQLSLFGKIPLKKITFSVLPNTQVIPCGMTVGVKFNTEGIMILGTGFVSAEDGNSYEPSKDILKAGDVIISVDNKQLSTKEQLISQVEKSAGQPVNFKVKRNNEILQLGVTPVKSAQDKQYKIGIWVRDSTQGIGTITYYNPNTNNFGALGHGILDVDTKQLMTVKSGVIMESEITSIKKGKKGSPGELIGNIEDDKVIGTIQNNTNFGIYGKIPNHNISTLPQEKMQIALQSEAHEGPAVIRSNIDGKVVKEYTIYIESVNRYTSDDSKGMVIRITDPALIEKTNGIVQGMSGSPIIQDGKLIGAVTHVFVQDPLKGYGIFIENMLKQENNVSLY